MSYSYSYDDDEAPYTCPSDDLDVGIQQRRSALVKEAISQLATRCEKRIETKEQKWRSSGLLRSV